MSGKKMARSTVNSVSGATLILDKLDKTSRTYNRRYILEPEKYICPAYPVQNHRTAAQVEDFLLDRIYETLSTFPTDTEASSTTTSRSLGAA